MVSPKFTRPMLSAKISKSAPEAGMSKTTEGFSVFWSKTAFNSPSRNTNALSLIPRNSTGTGNDCGRILLSYATKP